MKLFKDRRIIAVVAILLAAAVVIAIPTIMLSKGEKEVIVYTATRDIEDGELLHEDMITETKVPETLRGSAVTDKSKIVGSFASGKIWAGDYITASKCISTLPEEDRPDDGYAYVSVTVPSLAAGVAGHVQRGDYVAVVCYDEFPIENDDAETDDIGDAGQDEPIDGVRYPASPNEDVETEMRAYIPDGLEHVKVVDIRNSDNVPVDELNALDGEQQAVTPATVTLLVTNEQAIAVVEAEKSGTIHLVLVPEADTALPEENGGTGNDIQ